MAIVEKGDWIFINPDEKSEEILEWSQDFGDSRSASYISVPFIVKGKDAAGPLFIQALCSDKFFMSCTEADNENPFRPDGYKYKVQVTDEFQYGQNSERTFRFLVYHDKSNKPYQHRFTSSGIFLKTMKSITGVAKIGLKLVKAVPIIGNIVTAIESALDILPSMFGDYLHNF